jgi:hypothetical protein
MSNKNTKPLAHEKRKGESVSHLVAVYDPYLSS